MTKLSRGSKYLDVYLFFSRIKKPRYRINESNMMFMMFLIYFLLFFNSNNKRMIKIYVISVKKRKSKSRGKLILEGKNKYRDKFFYLEEKSFMKNPRT